MITVIATCNSHDAKRIQRRHKDTSTLKWIGATRLEKEQMFKVDGNSEILSEIAATLEIENFEIVLEYK